MRRSDRSASGPSVTTRSHRRARRPAILLACAASLLLLGAPASSAAKPPSFAVWWSHFSARVQKDIVHINALCQKRYGNSDTKVGACFVRHERVSLRAESVAWERQIAAIARNQRRSCRTAIHSYRQATRKAATANLRYLDTHRHTALTEISRDLNGQPFASLKSLTFRAKARAVRICG